MALQLALLLLLSPGAHALTSQASAKPAPDGFLVDQKIALSEFVEPYTETWASFRGVARSVRDFVLRMQPQASPVALLQTTWRGKQEAHPEVGYAYETGYYESSPEITWTHLLMQGCFTVLFVSFCALLYRFLRPMIASPRSEKVKLEAKYPNEFEYRLGDSRNCDPELFCCSFCCLGIRWAETVSDGIFGLMGFWPMFLIFSCLQGFGPLLFGFGYMIWLIMLVVCRQKIRQTYGLEHGNWNTYAEDCCSWFCCPACAGAQEARQLELVIAPQKRHESEQQAPEQHQALPGAVSGL